MNIKEEKPGHTSVRTAESHVTRALEDRQSRIFWKAGIGVGEGTTDEFRSAIVHHVLFVNAGRAEAGVHPDIVGDGRSNPQGAL